MGGQNEMARNLLAQGPGRDYRQLSAAYSETLPQKVNLQPRFLMQLHSLTEAQAHALAAFIWGACQ